MKSFKILTLALGLALGGVAHGADTYEIDDSSSEIGFSIKHWSITTVRGNFTDFKGSFRFDEKKPAKSKVEVSINVASVNTRNKRRDGHLNTPDFFDTAKYATATFKSKKVEAGSEPGSLMVTGDLTLHGVTRPVTLTVTRNGSIEDDGRGGKRIGFSAKGQINRTDFGIAWNAQNKVGQKKLSDEVGLDIQIEGLKK